MKEVLILPQLSLNECSLQSDVPTYHFYSPVVDEGEEACPDIELAVTTVRSCIQNYLKSPFIELMQCSSEFWG